MKIILFLTLLVNSIFSANFTKDSYIKQSITNGFNENKCTYGDSGIHVGGQHAAYSLAVSRARDKLVQKQCGDSKLNLSVASATISSRVILKGKIENAFVATVCSQKITCKK